ncbi:hypothetical protein AEST_15220 [Alishewanella aestuarii B11]|uniref:Uncharacterized protein n=1 Tax=Alishewanella aestuarii B11 TaxID=1197174 RepID=J1QJ73_9ALTE|nr:hypothetical protein AEST_15220 [Alishewanella aestuarii B11]
MAKPLNQRITSRQRQQLQQIAVMLLMMTVRPAINKGAI